MQQYATIILTKNESIFLSLETFLSQLPKILDIICLSETRTNENNVNVKHVNMFNVKHVNMRGYSYFYKHSKFNAGGSGIEATATFRFTSATPRRCVCDCLFSLSRDFMRLLVLQRFFYDQPTGVHVGD